MHSRWSLLLAFCECVALFLLFFYALGSTNWKELHCYYQCIRWVTQKLTHSHTHSSGSSTHELQMRSQLMKRMRRKGTFNQRCGSHKENALQNYQHKHIRLQLAMHTDRRCTLDGVWKWLKFNESRVKRTWAHAALGVHGLQRCRMHEKQKSDWKT